MQLRPQRRSLATRLRYVTAIARRFRITFLFALILFGLLPWAFIVLYPTPIGWARALNHVYFLLFGQPSLDYVDSAAIVALNILIPPFGLVAVVDGVVRFAYLFFAKKTSDKEWIEVIAESMRGHIIICGAGRVGFRIANQLSALGKEVVVIEKREGAPFATQLQDLNIPVLFDDARNPKALARLNVKHAQAIVCCTDDDLGNINVGLDARKANPEIRIVMRLFDEDLAERVRENFRAEAHSTSVLAGQTLALTSLDPRIIHSFSVGEHLMVVSAFVAGPKLAELNVSAVRDRFGGLTLSLRKPGAAEALHPTGPTQIVSGDTLTLQCRYDEYLALRAFTGEERPPLSLHGS
ncbi:MAG: potassium transporter TrkA [Myxococcaceae bacterium]|nr:potassium transporter TrkA [Myxococcaceae bacterium]